MKLTFIFWIKAFYIDSIIIIIVFIREFYIRRGFIVDMILGGEWGWGMGDGGLVIADWAQSPIPNPQSPIPNPQSPNLRMLFNILNIFILNQN